jgi:signal transduction histidine kinase
VPQVTAAIHDFRHTPPPAASPYNGRMKPNHWLTAAGFVTWIASGVPAALMVANGRIAGIAAVGWVVAFLVFGVAFSFICFGRAYGPRTEGALVAMQSIAGAVMVSVSRDGLAGATLVVAAAQLIELVPPSVAVLWVAAQTGVLAARFWWLDGIVTALVIAGAYLGFQMFAMATATLALRERVAREQLSRANAELHATRALLAEDSRVAERLRISRDLHDTLGHHLTALSLQLEVASRLAQGAAVDHVAEAHAITRLLLGDVRDAVGRLRDSSHSDLGAAIRTLADATPQLQVHVAVPDHIGAENPLQAHAILRCVQEVITNTMRHAQARNLWITLERREDGLVLTARDDGRGVDAVACGNGLRGMRERLEELSGRVDFSSSPGGGFEVQAFVPK